MPPVLLNISILCLDFITTAVWLKALVGWVLQNLGNAQAKRVSFPQFCESYLSNLCRSNCWRMRTDICQRSKFLRSDTQ